MAEKFRTCQEYLSEFRNKDLLVSTFYSSRTSLIFQQVALPFPVSRCDFFPARTDSVEGQSMQVPPLLTYANLHVKQNIRI